MHHTTSPLSRLVSMLGSSLAMYVSDAGIWTYPGGEEIKLAIAGLADDLRSFVDRAGVALEERGVEVPRPIYPIQFTATHDLDLRTLLPRIIAGLKSILGGLEGLSVDAATDPQADELLREAAASTRTHIDALEQVLARPRAATG